LPPSPTSIFNRSSTPCLYIHQDDCTCIPRRLRVRFQVEGFDELLGSFVKRSGIEADLDIAAVVPVAVVRLRYGGWFGKLNDESFLLHLRSSNFRLA
jgi:hypothetical protein